MANKSEHTSSENYSHIPKPGEYRVDGIHLGIGTSSGCQYIAFSCHTSNYALESNSFVVIYDKEIVEKYANLLRDKGVKSIGWNECKNLTDEFKYISPIKKYTFNLDKQYVRMYIQCVSPSASGPGKIENYDGWEYDIGITQDPSIGMGLNWWEEKQIQEAWLKYPFSPDAYPVIHTYVEVYVFNNPENCTESNIELLKNRIMRDFYREYNKNIFKIKPNRDYNP